ncbi:MAG: threonine synthase [Christensenellaceae bacterium]|jgi:threonine synthase|nr:threonine synthase [Christensenellaceae bacterium]
MEYISTRGARVPSSSSAILHGLAPDGGLFVPAEFPIISASDLDALKDMTYADRASFILSKYLTDYDVFDLKEICAKAYSKFDDSDPAPLIKIDDSTYIMELWHGPTLAFKDVALSVLPYLMTYARNNLSIDKTTLILVATSGDTGKAALEGFSDVAGTEIIVFYPSDGVSKMQKLQMQTTVGKNVHVVGIKGNFDDAQAAVKSIFKNEEIIKLIDDKGFSLSSANSINWGRLVPQIVYYFSAYVDLINSDEITNGDLVNFVVPTGNFGNVLAGFYAKKMGLPIDKLLVASNTNNVLTDFFNKGTYDSNRRFFKTISPSMDILISSNLERLLFEVFDRNPDTVKRLMTELDIYGSYIVPDSVVDEMSETFDAYWSDEGETKEALYNFNDMFDYLLDPHTAVAVSAYFTFIDDEIETKSIILSTANPYKFPDSVFDIISNHTDNEKDIFKIIRKLEISTGVEAPEIIKNLSDLSVIHTDVIDKNEVMDKVLSILDSKQLDNKA